MAHALRTCAARAPPVPDVELFEATTLAKHSRRIMLNDEQQLLPMFSRKVFVGGLPVDADPRTLEKEFSQFGRLHADWPPVRKGTRALMLSVRRVLHTIQVAAVVMYFLCTTMRTVLVR
jgi:hypothetical protein